MATFSVGIKLIKHDFKDLKYFNFEEGKRDGGTTLINPLFPDELGKPILTKNQKVNSNQIWVVKLVISFFFTF